MGIPLYGYDWTLPYVRGNTGAKSLSPQQALEIASENNVTIEYDEVAQAPYFITLKTKVLTLFGLKMQIVQWQS